MFCMHCNKDIPFCVCPDIDERMRALKDHPNLAIAWCKKCDHARSRCICVDNTTTH